MEKQQHRTLESQVKLLKEIVATDLEKKLSEFKSRKIGVRLFAQKINVNERTVTRLLKQENRPTYQTLLKIYGVIFNTLNESLIVELAPEIVANEIKKHYPEVVNKRSSPMPDIGNDVLHDRCFTDLYVMASCGPLSLDFVQYRYGIHGVETIDRMVELRVLKTTKEGHYIPGANEVEFTPKVLKRVGQSISEKFSKPDNSELGGENLIAFYAEGLSDEAYDEWLQVDEQAFKKKVEISQRSGAKGNKKVFTYMVTDTFKE
jgi:hypothetical protein